MKAIGLTRYLPISDPQSLVDVDLPKPAPAGRDLLVKVEAIAVNPVDTKVRSPKPKVEETPRVLGWDAAGIVEAVGAGVTLFRPGDAVFYAGSIVRPGANSEYHLIDERIVGKKPKSLDFAAAAALPLTSITAWESMFDRLGIDPTGKHAGRAILIVGGAGGVGSIAIQLAKKLAKMTVITTASRPDSIAWCKKAGADHVIDHFGDMPAQMKALGFAHVDFVFCLNDTDRHWKAMAEIVAPQGRICSIVENTGPLDLQPLRGKSAGFIWEVMFTRSTFQTPDMIEQHNLLNRVADLVDSGVIFGTATEAMTPINAANLRAAHAKLEAGRTIGKIVLSGFG